MDKKEITDYLFSKGNFVDDGKFFMVYCPSCNKENHSMWVAGSQCAWCGFQVEDEMAKGLEKD